MKVYGRVQDGVVAELISTDVDIATMFHPALAWIDLSAYSGVAPGWLWNGGVASAPVETPRSPAARSATLAELQSQISALQTRLAALMPVTIAGSTAG